MKEIDIRVVSTRNTGIDADKRYNYRVITQRDMVTTDIHVVHVLEEDELKWGDIKCLQKSSPNWNIKFRNGCSFSAMNIVAPVKDVWNPARYEG
jgi:hypothetical protein